MQGGILKWERVKGSLDWSILAQCSFSYLGSSHGAGGQVDAKKSCKNAESGLSRLCPDVLVPHCPAHWVSTATTQGLPVASSTPPVYLQWHFQACTVRTLCVSPKCFPVSQSDPLMSHIHPHWNCYWSRSLPQLPNHNPQRGAGCWHV